MKIAFVTSTLTSGGSERVMSLLANELANRGHEVFIVLLRAPIVFYDIQESVKIYYAENHSHNMLKKLIWFRGLIKTEHPDVVIPFMTQVYCATILSLMGVNVPIISSERIDPRFSKFINKVYRWCLLRFTTHLVVQTKAIKAYYPTSIQKRTTIIPNPITDSIFENYPDVNKEKIIVSVGRLYAQKNQKMMIDAFADIANKYPDYKLIIYGEGPIREQLTEYINAKELSGKVLLPGRSNNIAKELNRAEIFCLSSDYEGMSNALLEAVCVGLPVVTTNVSGVEDLLNNGKNGFVVDVGDTKSMSMALDQLLGDKDIRMKFSQYNKQMGQYYTIDRIATDWENLIKHIVI